MLLPEGHQQAAVDRLNLTVAAEPRAYTAGGLSSEQADHRADTELENGLDEQQLLANGGANSVVAELEEPATKCCKSQIHLAFLFASPLMLKTSESKYYDVLPPIGFSEEFEQIKQNIEEKPIIFNYRYSVANERNLQTALRENPIGLHFSGHGFQNNEKLFQGDKKGWLKYKNKGDVLIFESENGSSEFFFTSDLKKMFEDIQKQNQMLKARNSLLMHPSQGMSLSPDGLKSSKTQGKVQERENLHDPKSKPTEL